jgi:hypothetical protein
MVTALMIAFLNLIPAKAAVQDSVRIFFIYGSSPAKGFEKTEREWFGGIHGGHVAMEIAPNSLLSFRSTEYPCHIIPHKRLSSIWELKTVYGMWETFPPHNYKADDLKRVVFTIPVTAAQKRTIDSLAKVYLKHSPYDYATFGMRCASATYDVLAKAGLFKEYGGSTWWRIIMPRDLRTLLFKKAQSSDGKSWKVHKYEGSKRRVWERDNYL